MIARPFSLSISPLDGRFRDENKSRRAIGKRHAGPRIWKQIRTRHREQTCEG
jgi:hypothetical protein